MAGPELELQCGAGRVGGNELYHAHVFGKGRELCTVRVSDRGLHSRNAIKFHAFDPLEALPCV
jgi:hypothetical protein